VSAAVTSTSRLWRAPAAHAMERRAPARADERIASARGRIPAHMAVWQVVCLRHANICTEAAERKTLRCRYTLEQLDELMEVRACLGGTP